MRRPVVRCDPEVWVRRAGAVVVAGVGAYASYVHQREFALQGGADPASAALWPLSVDGLLLLATVGLLKPSGRGGRRARCVVWLAFLLGIAVSLAANIAAAPALAWKPVLVAGWPPVALLLSVELLAHRSAIQAETERDDKDDDQSDGVREHAQGDLLDVPGAWMPGTGSCISVRSRLSRYVRNCGSVPTGRGSWWRWCVQAVTAAVEVEISGLYRLLTTVEVRPLSRRPPSS